MIELPKDIEKALAALPKLPSLPAVASRVVTLAGNDQTTFQTIAREIEKDPALVAALLKVANSSYYSRGTEVSSAQRAIIVLGAGTVRQICLGVSVMSAFPRTENQATFDRAAFWRHSGACAVACRSLAKRLETHSDGEEFTAGLLHGVGQLLLDVLFHERYNEAIKISHRDGVSMRAAEQHVFGTCYSDVGAWLCQRWKLPERLVEAIRYHHEPSRATIDPTLAALVNLGELFARVSGSGFGGERTPVAVAETAAWQVLAAGGATVDVDLERLTFELTEEMERHRDMFLEQ